MELIVKRASSGFGVLSKGSFALAFLLEPLHKHTDTDLSSMSGEKVNCSLELYLRNVFMNVTESENNLPLLIN